MKISPIISLLLTLLSSSVSIAEETSNKDGTKTGAETVVNGAALIGIVGAASGQQSNTDNQRHPKTWGDLKALQRSRPGVAEFGK
jgi:hypothetical protein